MAEGTRGLFLRIEALRAKLRKLGEDTNALGTRLATSPEGVAEESLTSIGEDLMNAATDIRTLRRLLAKEWAEADPKLVSTLNAGSRSEASD